MNIAADIFGGTFDPVQNGHLELIKNALVSSRCLVVAPTTQNPWKDRAATPMELRMEMLRLCFQGENLRFSEDAPRLGEIYLCTHPYERSVELLRWWRSNYGSDIRWLVGPGDAASSERWFRWTQEGCPVVEMTSSYPFHSTDVRAQKTGAHPSIREFIETHQLYK